MFDIFTEALQQAGWEGITRQDVLPAPIDFVTSLALTMASEPGARATITRIERRIEGWKAGNFADRSGTG